ncbi:TonB-dependent siderophore receptor [Agrobacterium larrymoorei]|uniref:TonB-dependent siderophore receptor n=1 Tax=Agrobacterium larrymoorei TaxID=160699 RepID=A0AAF0HBD5_9HYPH|nr:TonB-dependent siderophore receptor [Agrobacterium larrymoorei]WHA42562.1 TonB-dependent siderophore receptor [Agrobacterium larrymoorei]
MLLTRLLTGTALLVLGVPHASFAQEAGTTVLEQITVQGAGDATGTGPVDGYVAKKSTSGSKSDTPLKEIPQSVSVVGRQEMDDRGVVTKVDEVLRYTPGVTAEPFGTDPDTDWFYIRGFNATQTGVFLDGLNLFSYGFGGFQMDAYGLERVEVLKGPASVLYGGANPGGIVQMISKRPQDEPIRETEIGINNFGNAFFGFDLGDKIDDEGVWKYRVTGKVSGGDNYTDYSEDLRGFIMPQITFEPDAQTSATVYGYFSALDQVHIGNGFLPYVGTVVDAPFGKLDRKAFYGEPDIDNGRVYQSMVGYEVKRELDNGIELSQNARYGHLYKHEIGPYTFGYVGGTPTGPDYDLYRIGFEGLSKVDTFNVDNRLSATFDTGAIEHKFLAGIDYKYYRLGNEQKFPFYLTPTTPISATDPVYGTPQAENILQIDELLTQQQMGVYAQDRMRFGDGWIATFNGRYDYVDTNLDNKLPGGVSRSSNDSAFSGRAGLAYEFDNGLTPYLSVATFFNPLVDKVGAFTSSTAAKPEEGEQFEAGIKYEPTSFDGSITASVFKIIKQNALVSSVDGSGTTISSQYGEVESQGFELEAKANLNENWKALASYSYTDLEVTRDANPAYVGKSPWVVPNQTASLWLDYSFTNEALEGLSVGGGVRFKGRSYADQLNEFEVPTSTVFDAAIRYEKNDWTASVNVANLFDREYVASCQGVSVCGWGDSRTITFKLSKKW